MTSTESVSIHSVLLAMGYVAGGLTQPAIFAQLVESLQDSDLEPGHIVFVRDTLTRALQLSGVEAMP